MKSQIRLSLIFFTLLLYGIQIWHTIYNQVNWPFCSHNFYYHRSPLIKELFSLTLEDNTGTKVNVDPRHVLPIEGYRCGSIFREVFAANFKEEKKQLFAKLLLERLNQGGWQSFDERFSPAVPTFGCKFTGLQIEKHLIDTRDYAKTQNLTIIKKENLYRYKSE